MPQVNELSWNINFMVLTLLFFFFSMFFMNFKICSFFLTKKIKIKFFFSVLF